MQLLNLWSSGKFLQKDKLPPYIATSVVCLVLGCCGVFGVLSGQLWVFYIGLNYYAEFI